MVDGTGESHPVATAVRHLRAAAGFSLAQLAATATISKAYAHRIESGLNDPTPAVVASLDAALGAAGYLIALARCEDDMHRRTVLAAITALAAGAGEWGRLVDGSDINLPGRVGAGDVQAVADAVGWVTSIDTAQGGQAAAGPGRAVLGWAVRLLDGEIPDDTRRRLAVQVAALADRVGWAHHDAGRDDVAARLYGVALKAARFGQDSNVEAHVMIDEAARRATRRDYGSAATLLAGALDFDLLPTVRANTLLVWARHIAMTGDHDGALEAVGRADDVLSSARSLEVPDWAAGFLPGAHLSNVKARSLLAAGDYEHAIAEFGTVVGRLGPQRARGRSHSRALLGLAYLRAGYPDMAAATAEELLTAPPALASARVARDVSALAVELRQRGHGDVGRELAVLAARVTPAATLDAH